MNRNQILRSTGAGGLMMAAAPMLSFKNRQVEQLDKKAVKTFVGASHGDMALVKELLHEFPTLLNAAHDWEKGDFETGLGAASHVGFKELAQYFLDQGAQANIFTACLFGKIDIVRPMLKGFPKTLYAKGPHGYTLLHHAEQGGEEALEVMEYFVSLGATNKIVALF